MLYEIYAQITARNEGEIEAISNGSLVRDCYTQLKLLSGGMIDERNLKTARSVHKKIVYECKSYNIFAKYELERMKSLKLCESEIVNINKYPPFSFFLQFIFKLAKPYISKDGEEFYICENPIRKDKVFKVPMVAGSSWKGNMRWTARQIKKLNALKTDKPDTAEILRLFGNEKSNEKEFKRGYLNFYPTFFDQISLEVINPHDRKTKAGTIPVYIESVPAGASGTFSLLYVPFDLMGKPSEEIKQQVAEDINLVYNSLKEMMLTYGFSAKKSSGFGVTEEVFNPPGIIKINGGEPEESPFSDFKDMDQKMKQMLKPVRRE